jgi:hypothetical protein
MSLFRKKPREKQSLWMRLSLFPFRQKVREKKLTLEPFPFQAKGSRKEADA